MSAVIGLAIAGGHPKGTAPSIVCPSSQVGAKTPPPKTLDEAYAMRIDKAMDTV